MTILLESIQDSINVVRKQLYKVSSDVDKEQEYKRLLALEANLYRCYDEANVIEGSRLPSIWDGPIEK